MIIEGDESLMNPDYLRVVDHHRVVEGMLAVMNPSVADKLKHEATDGKNGTNFHTKNTLLAVTS